MDWVKPKVEKGDRNKFFETRQLSKLEEGDKLYVVTKDSVTYDIIYFEVANGSIQGQFLQKNDKRIKMPIEGGIPISNIRVLKVRRFNVWATVGTGIGVPVVAFVLMITLFPPKIDLTGFLFY